MGGPISDTRVPIERESPGRRFTIDSCMGKQASLTPRETEVMDWILEGKTNADISKILGISPRTVEKHCERIFQKLGVENRYAAIVYSMRAQKKEK